MKASPLTGLPPNEFPLSEDLFFKLERILIVPSGYSFSLIGIEQWVLRNPSCDIDKINLTDKNN
jgi:hypothetical protein